MTHAWMPGAGRVRARTDGGPLKGGAPRTVWQALGFDPHTVSARAAAQRLDQLGRPCHLVWNPLDGEIVQLIPIIRAARSLGWPEGSQQLTRPGNDAPALASSEQQTAPQVLAAAHEPADRLCEVNTEGRLCVQICVVAFAWEPFTASPMIGLQAILDWLDSWRMPRRWPAGRPAPYPHGYVTSANRRLWARGGHFGASQVPEWAAVGPGCVDVERLTGQDAVACGRSTPATRGDRAAARGDRAAAGGSQLPHAGTPGQARQTAAARTADLDDIFGGSPADSSLTRVG